MIAAAVLPHPPLLVPEVATGAAAEVAPLLHACDAAVADLVARRPDLLVCVGDGSRTRPHPAGSWGTFAGLGVDLRAPSAPPSSADPGEQEEPARPSLPLSLTVGRWLLERAGWTGRLLLHEVAVDADPALCAELGRRLTVESGPGAAWLVLGDASSTRTEKAPGYLDPRAEGFDAGVARALAGGDAAALAGLDAGLARELGAAGRAPWQVLAAAAGGGRWPGRAELRHDAAPYGVGYLVATWLPA